MTETHKDLEMSIKQANVVIYATVCIKVNGAEGETYKEIIENAEEAIDKRVIDDLKKVYVDPHSPTAKNLMGEVVYFEMDESQSHHYVVIENEFEDNQTEKGFENHPLGFGPVPVNEKGEDVTNQALQLLAQIVQWEDNKETLEVIRNGKMNEWIEQARSLTSDEMSDLGKSVVNGIRSAFENSLGEVDSNDLDKPPKN